jgi:serine/threonine-protein kinase
LASGASPGGAVSSTPELGAAADVWSTLRLRLEEATRGRYEIIRQIGAGGMAAVFLARHASLHREVAIKVMAPGLLTSAGMIERFLAEARTIAKFRCQNIVQVYEVEKAGGDLYFFVMEYIRGSSLDKVLREHGRLSLELARVILYEIGQGLAYAHRRGVIHRDIKPSNIMLDSEGLSILTDFGIAKHAEGEGMTQSGARIGTPAYMSPEQCNGLQLAWTSDQYSLGIVAYEMLVGYPPFKGLSFEVQAAHVAQRPPPITDVRPDCPADVSKAIARMLAKAPDQRWPSVAEALQALGCKAAEDGDTIRGQLAFLTAQASEERKPLSSDVPAPSGTPSTVERVTLQSLPGLLHPGDTAQLVAQPLGHRDESVPGRVIVWSSSDSAVVSVDGDGRLTAKAPGRSRIVARCDGKSIVADVEVTIAEVAAIDIDEVSLLEQGQVAQLAVRVCDHRGINVEGSSIRWTSSDERVARVSPEGTVTAGAVGTAVLTASADSASASCTVTVAPALIDSVAPVGPPDSTGVGGVTAVRWAPTVVLVASVIGTIVLAAPLLRSRLFASNAAPIVMGAGMGVSEGSGGENGRGAAPGDTLSAPPAPVADPLVSKNRTPTASAGPTAATDAVVRIVVDSPQPTQSVAVGDSIVLTAHPVTASGARSTTTISWSVADTAAAVLRGPSLLVGKAPGRTTVRASIANPRIDVSQVVEIVSPTITALHVVGDPETLPNGSRVTLGLRATDARGRPVAVPPVTWSSSNPAVATIAGSGEVEAHAAGTAVVSASAGGRTAETVIRVPAPPQETRLPPRDSVVASPPDARPEPILRSAILKHVALLQQADISGLQAVYPVESAGDRANLARLTSLLRTREYRTQVDAEPAIIGAPTIVGSQATWSYSVRLRWRNNFGVNLSELVTFETRFEKTASTWRLTSARLAGNPRIG